MKQYINMVKRVLRDGKWKSPVRKVGNKWEPVDGGVRTKAVPNVFFSHEMSDGFPLLTTKKMAWKAIKVELEGFIKGITDKEWFQDRNCKIWDEWANPVVVGTSYNASVHNAIRNNESNPDKKQIQKDTKDLGPIYGYQWRHFGEQYGSNCTEIVPGGYRYDGENGLKNGADQLATIVETLRSNPMDRRMVCSAWNPNQISMMALPPCHYAWNVTVIDNKLNLFWAQRSADLMLGVPFNIASYGLLLSLLAKDAELEVGNLSACFVDCHIYENQLEGALEQASREPQKLPKLVLKPNVQNMVAPDEFDIFNWDHNKAIIEDYTPLDRIKFGDVVV